ncbi:MAG: glycosyltransferase family 4 protein [Lachnospiraceae bacterium]|nr:glycosyltransferase family 4 protein [Lachnospiraceae bacterium]
MSIRIGIVELYCGGSGEKGFYNSQEIGMAKEYIRRGYECYIFRADKNISRISEEIPDGMEGIKYISIPSLKTVGVHGRFDPAVLDRYEIDIFQIEGDNQLFLPGLIRHLKKAGPPFFYYLGVLHSNSKSRPARLIMNILIKRNIKLYRQGKCFVKTGALREECLRAGIRDVTLAPVGLDLSVIPKDPGSVYGSRKVLSEKYGLDPYAKWLLFVGRMEEYKRPLDAVKVIKALKGWQLIMIGTGSLNEAVDREADKIRNDRKILHIHKIENKNMFIWYSAADCFLNLNPDEIFGMSMMEANIRGCRVVAVTAPGPLEIIKEGLNGFIAESPEEAAGLIDRELDRERIREYAVRNFTWARAVDEFEEYIKNSFPDIKKLF